MRLLVEIPHAKKAVQHRQVFMMPFSRRPRHANESRKMGEQQDVCVTHSFPRCGIQGRPTYNSTHLPQMRHKNSDLHTAAYTTAMEQGRNSLKRMSQEQHTTEQDTERDRNEIQAQTTSSSQRHTLNACAAGSALLGTRWRTEDSLGGCGDKKS